MKIEIDIDINSHVKDGLHTSDAIIHTGDISDWIIGTGHGSNCYNAGMSYDDIIDGTTGGMHARDFDKRAFYIRTYANSKNK